MNQANSIIKYANDIINEASFENKTWSTSFHHKLVKSVSTMPKQEAHLFIKIIMDEILTNHLNPFAQFKLCQVCSIIRNQDLKSFQNAFIPFHSKISEYLNTEAESMLHSVIKSHLTNFMREPKMIESKTFSNIRYLSNLNEISTH
jgi:hypothetical protein